MLVQPWVAQNVTFCCETTCNRYISPGSRRTHTFTVAKLLSCSTWSLVITCGASALNWCVCRRGGAVGQNIENVRCNVFLLAWVMDQCGFGPTQWGLCGRRGVHSKTGAGVQPLVHAGGLPKSSFYDVTDFRCPHLGDLMSVGLGLPSGDSAGEKMYRPLPGYRPQVRL